MQLGVIGLGRMGANIARRPHRAGHHCVVYKDDIRRAKTLESKNIAYVDVGTSGEGLLRMCRRLQRAI